MTSSEEEAPTAAAGDDEDYKLLAEQCKDKGNAAFQLGTEDGVKTSIQLYTQAIDLDPDNHVYYSNRSAAYLKADSKSKALWDAEKCVALKADWPKGYSRLGAAQQSLRRFDEALETFKKAVELDPNNKAAWSALRNCEAAAEADKKQRFKDAVKEREYDETQQRLREEAKSREKVDLNTFVQKLNNEIDPEENLLNDFFSELGDGGKKEDEERNAKKMEQVLAENPGMYKYAVEDLGDPEEQVARLTGQNYQFRNLNPYFVLQLDIDATDEDVKFRYRKLSVKVHPDKLIGIEAAREAFEQVKLAYQRLMDPVQKQNVIANIEYVRQEVAKDRKRLLGKGARDADLLPLDEEIKRRTMMHFAEIEMQKRRSEHCLRAHSARERLLEDQQKEHSTVVDEFEKEWAQEDRRENRVGNWRTFQVMPEAKRAKVETNFKQERREDNKFGKVVMNEWKKSWK